MAAPVRLDVAAFDVPSTRPWTAEGVLRVLIQNVVAVVGLAVSAYLTARADDTQRSLLWLNVGIGAVVFAGLMNGLWLLRTRRLVSRAHRQAASAITQLVQHRSPAVDSAPSSTTDVVAASDGVTFHRPRCAFVANRGTRDLTVDDAIADGLRACEVCRP